MSDDEPKDESTDDSEQQAGEQATDSDQPAGQPEQQSVESDQSAEQPEDQAATSDESAEQLVEQPAESDQTTEQSEGQPSAESDPSAGQSDEATGGDDGGGGSGGGVGGPADDAVAADAGKKLQVTAEFTQEGGQKFFGDIKISVYEWDEQKGQQGGSMFGGDVQDWQLFDDKKPSSITTPMLRVTSSAVRIYADARVPGAAPTPQMSMSAVFDFSIPKGDTLLAKLDVEVGKVDETVTASNADEAKGKVIKLPQFAKKPLIQLDAKPIGKQTPPQFRVTGKVYTGHISLRQ